MSTVYSVTQLNNQIKGLLESNPPFRNIFVQGEISNFKQHYSGHLYLTLKDEGAAISAVMFRSDAARLKFRPENGAKIIARGRVSSFPKSGQVQLYVSDMIPDGAGALQLAFEQLKRKLLAEGLFDESRKRPIPSCPSQIALVTSPTGAAVRDMIRILGRRWPLAKITLFPAQVQGKGAAQSICHALALANAIGEAEVILCGRGGGSVEDLWAFNEEPVARAIAESAIPVISAVGHEPDVTIADFVADLRAPTPSGAAELAVPDRGDYRAAIHAMEGRLLAAQHKRISREQQRLAALSDRLQLHTPLRYIADKRLQLDQVTERLFASVPQRVQRERQTLRLAQQRLCSAGQTRVKRDRLHFAQTVAALDALSPLRVLARGYAVAQGEEGVVTDAATLRKNDALHLRFAKGSAVCRVETIQEEN